MDKNTFIKNPRLAVSLSLAALQQCLLALSTYYIAMAGASLGENSTSQTISSISLFFIFAIFAYLTSSASTVLGIQAANHIWEDYAKHTLHKVCSDLRYTSTKNKNTTIQWINGEASITISQACSFYLGLTTTTLNIALTMLVFYISLGAEFTLTVSTSLIVSAALVGLLRKKIEKLAGDIQATRLTTLTAIESTWDSTAFGTTEMREEAFRKLSNKAKTYFSDYNKYNLTEQAIACTPIVLAVAAVVTAMNTSEILTTAKIGTIVAILPRSLQIFGSIHSASLLFSQFYLIRAKVKNLIRFSEKLEPHDIRKAYDSGSFTIHRADSGSCILAEHLEERIISGEIKTGRYSITGRNGSGKTSYLKTIKSLTKNSILVTPESHFFETEIGVSTGQARVAQILEIMKSPPKILMLDEWDANLDRENTETIDSLLNKLSPSTLVIETRHKKPVQDIET